MRIFAHEFTLLADQTYDAYFEANVSGPPGPFHAERIEVTNEGGQTIYFSPNGGYLGIPVYPGQTRTIEWCHHHETAKAHGLVEWTHVRVWGRPGKRAEGSVVAIGRCAGA